MRPPSPALAAAIAAAVALAGCASIRRPRSVLQDDTASWGAQAGCDLDASRPGCAEVLTDAEREALERFLSRAVDGLTERTIERVRFRVLAPDAPAATVRHVGGTVELPARNVRWALGDRGERTTTGADALLAFGFAHELGHITTECAGGCQASLECERAADAAARRIASPLILHQVATEDSETLLGRLDAELARTGAAGVDRAAWGELADDCLRLAETYLRYSAAEEDWAWSQRKPGWDDRAATQRRLEGARVAVERGRRVLAVCRDATRLAPPGERGECLAARLGTAEGAYGARTAPWVPAQDDPALWPPSASRTGDAELAVVPDVGPAWSRSPGRVVRSGWLARALVLWEGGTEEPIGLRAGWARLGDAAGPGGPRPGADATLASLELVGRGVVPLGPVALVVDGGLGAFRTAVRGESAATRPGVSLDARVAWPLTRRLHVTVGAGGTAIPTRLGSEPEGTLVGSATAGLELHLGAYGARRARAR